MTGALRISKYTPLKAKLNLIITHQLFTLYQILALRNQHYCLSIVKTTVSYCVCVCVCFECLTEQNLIPTITDHLTKQNFLLSKDKMDKSHSRVPQFRVHRRTDSNHFGCKSFEVGWDLEREDISGKNEQVICWPVLYLCWGKAWSQFCKRMNKNKPLIHKCQLATLVKSKGIRLTMLIHDTKQRVNNEVGTNVISHSKEAERV